MINVYSWFIIALQTFTEFETRIKRIPNYRTTHICPLGMWHDYFKSLYNSVPDNHDRDYVVNACSEVNKDVFDYISVTDVANAIHGLKAAKSAGPITV